MIRHDTGHKMNSIAAVRFHRSARINAIATSDVVKTLATRTWKDVRPLQPNAFWTLSARLETLRAHEQAVVQELQRHGYLHGHD